MLNSSTFSLIYRQQFRISKQFTDDSAEFDLLVFISSLNICSSIFFDLVKIKAYFYEDHILTDFFILETLQRVKVLEYFILFYGVLKQSLAIALDM